MSEPRPEMTGLADIAPGYVCVTATEWEQVYDKPR